MKIESVSLEIQLESSVDPCRKNADPDGNSGHPAGLPLPKDSQFSLCSTLALSSEQPTLCPQVGTCGDEAGDVSQGGVIEPDQLEETPLLHPGIDRTQPDRGAVFVFLLLRVGGKDRNVKAGGQR